MRKAASQRHRPARFPRAKTRGATPPGIEPGSPRLKASSQATTQLRSPPPPQRDGEVRKTALLRSAMCRQSTRLTFRLYASVREGTVACLEVMLFASSSRNTASHSAATVPAVERTPLCSDGNYTTRHSGCHGFDSRVIITIDMIIHSSPSPQSIDKPFCDLFLTGDPPWHRSGAIYICRAAADDTYSFRPVCRSFRPTDALKQIPDHCNANDINNITFCATMPLKYQQVNDGRSAVTVIANLNTTLTIHALLHTTSDMTNKTDFIDMASKATASEDSGKRDIPEKTGRPVKSSGTIPTCKNPGGIPLEIEPGSLRRVATVNLLASHQSDSGSIAGRVTPDFCKWESCRTMPLFGGFSMRFPVSPTLSFRRFSILTQSPPSALKTSMLRATQRFQIIQHTLRVSRKPAVSADICSQRRTSLKEWDVPARLRSRSEGAIRATLTRTPSSSSLLGARHARPYGGQQQPLSSIIQHKPAYLGNYKGTTSMITLNNVGSRGGLVVRLLATHPGELGSAGPPRIFTSRGQRVFPGIFRFPRSFIPALLHTHISSPSSALKTSMSEGQNTRLVPRRNGFHSQRGQTCISACGKRGGHCRLSSGFLGVRPFPLHVHSTAAPHSPHFIFPGTQDQRNCAFKVKKRGSDTGLWDLLHAVKAHRSDYAQPIRVIELNRERHRNERAGNREIPEKAYRPTTSSGTIPTWENPVTRLGIEPGSPWWEASVIIVRVESLWRLWDKGAGRRSGETVHALSFRSPDPICTVQRYDGNTARLARRSDEVLGVRVTVAHIALSRLR
ncbi:hypothetical protein PR048_025277 [Dryococelus australis]|uniref:Uncharacterized protein n=1 Tax=Dryococelus australis TaxID=614101 RepID=A0ABQ9GQX9_9NEOP|nr:hypothetical protein PR048_025277 [Dryococelus australis]